MKPKSWRSLCIFLYELYRVSCLLTAHPESSIELLPASWFASIPLLVLPALLALPAVKKPNSTERFLYLLAKVSSCIGLAAYLAKALPFLPRGALNNYYSLHLFAQIVLFLLIDVIISLILFIQNRRKVNDADNPDSER